MFTASKAHRPRRGVNGSGSLMRKKPRGHVSQSPIVADDKQMSAKKKQLNTTTCSRLGADQFEELIKQSSHVSEMLNLMKPIKLRSRDITAGSIVLSDNNYQPSLTAATATRNHQKLQTHTITHNVQMPSILDKTSLAISFKDEANNDG